MTMKLEKDLLEIIEKYLKGTESDVEREKLFLWYDALGNGNTADDSEKLSRMYYTAKNRLLAQVGKEDKTSSVRWKVWYTIAAAITVIGSSIAIFSYLKRSETTIVQSTEMARITPLNGKAKLSLSNGDEVSLDTLNTDHSMNFGSASIQKKGIGTLIFNSNGDLNKHEAIATLATANGSQYNLTLSDGTKVWLNSNSTLKFPENFGSGERLVSLDGEAYFEVSKKTDHRKFIVKTKGQAITVLGTKFNVNGHFAHQEVKTTLLEGRVAVKPQNIKLKTQVLLPNQQAILGNGYLHVLKVDASQIVSWKSGYFSFDNSSVEELASKIGAWYGIPIEYNSTAHTSRYTGKIPKNISLGQLQKLLSYQEIKLKLYKDNSGEMKIILN